MTSPKSNNSKLILHFDEKNENEKLCEYEKIRLRNIAERKKMFQEMNLDQLKRNVAVIPVNKAQSFKCESCGKSFSKESNLNKHFKSVHVGTRPKSAREKKNIKRFSEEFQMECPECNFIALGQSGLNQHQKRKHKICNKKVSKPVQDSESSTKNATSAGNESLPKIQFTNLANINEAIGKLFMP